MGCYLSNPVTKKISHDEQSTRVSYGSSFMQGWRVSQEDAHNCIIDFDDNVSLFAVYDGHGGAEVANYCSLNLPDCLRSISEYKNGNLSQALEDAFLEFDACLTKPEVVAELKQMAGLPNSDEDSEEDAEALNEEANLPLNEVLARYETSAVKKVAARVGEYEKPKSPMLRGKKNEQKEDRNGIPAVPDKIKGDKKDSVTLNGVLLEKTEETVKSEDDDDTKVKEKVDNEPQSGSTAEKQSNVDEEAANTKVEEPGCSSGDSKKRKPNKKGSFAVTSKSSSDEEESEDDEEYNAADSSSAEGEGDDSEEGDEDEDEEESDESEEDETEMHDMIHQNSEEEPGKDSGCTAVVALLKGKELYVANAGDSRCVVCRQGKAVNLSFDHKPEDPLESKRIEGAGGRVTCDGRVNGGLNLSRAIGDHTYKENTSLSPKEQMITSLPDIQTLTIDPKDDEFMILACDGIWNCMSSQEVVDFVQKHLKEDCKLSTICEKLFDQCLAPNTDSDGTGCDNMTAIIVKFNDLDHLNNKRPSTEEDKDSPDVKKQKT